MNKLLIAGIFCMLALPALPVPAAEKPEVPADGITMNRSGKRVVIFNHSTHKEHACEDCHHLVEDKQDYRSCTTAGCHDNFDPKDKSSNSYKQMTHKKKDPKFQSCASCHEKTAGEDKEKKKALTACAKSKCHP